MHPTQLGPYLMRSRLGRGGMGEVYEAVDSTTGETVAVKILRSHLTDDPGVRQRFRAEIDALKSLRHPGIVRMLAFGEQDDEPYYAMEFVRGESLDQVLRAGRRFSWRQTLGVAGDVARALKAAHDQGIIHRDLKPANLLMVETGTDGSAAPQSTGTAAAGGISVKLADFGIAKLFGGVAQTAYGHVIGTVEYMAPEQAAGRPVDHRADLYALGMVMYAMMAGGPPFRGTTLTEIIDKQRHAIPPRLATVVADIPPELDELVARMLAKDPAQRPASALALARLLTAIEHLHPADAPVPVRRDPGGRIPDVRSGAPVTRNTAPPTAGPASAIPPRPSAPAPAKTEDPLTATRTLAAAVAPAPPAAPRRAGEAAAPPAPRSRLATDVASAKTLEDHSPGNRFTTIEDLKLAEAIRDRQERTRQVVWNVITAVVVLGVAAWGGWRLLRPPTADELHGRIMAVANDEHGDLRDVRDAMGSFLALHGDDPRAGRIRELERTLELDILERRARRRLRGDAPVEPVERDYRAAMAEEENGPSACVKALEAMIAVYDGASADSEQDPTAQWIALARRQVQRLRPKAVDEQKDDAKRIAGLLAEAQSFADRGRVANDDAARQQFAALRRAKLENIIEVYENRPHAAEAVKSAREALAALDASAPRPSAPVSPPQP